MPTASSTPDPDLFSLSAGDESGYERWQAEVAAEQMAAVARREVEELPQAVDETGHAHWQREMAEARLEFERRWGVPLGHRVRVMLRDDEREIEGLLRVVEREAATKKLGLMLAVDGREFRASEVVSIVRT
jgi:hypothetical protein